MKRISYVIAVIIGTLLLILPSTAEASSFKDVRDNHTFFREITHLVSLGALNGYPDGTFKPENKVTRGQAAKIITEALNMPLKNPKNPTFRDVSRNHDFYRHIETLAAHGIISGSGGRFKPQGSLTRAQMAKIVSNSMRLTKTSNRTFTDVSKKDEFYPFIDKLAATGITTGCGAKKFCPNRTVTRGQISAFISRGLEKWLSSDEFVFDRGLKIGMTQAQVIALEGQPTYRDPDRLEYEWVAHTEFGAELLLYFTNNKLDHIIIYFNIDGLEMIDTEEYFNQIVGFLYNPRYGTPTDGNYKWKDQGGYETLFAEWTLGKGEFYKVEMSTEPGRKKYYFSSNRFSTN